MLFLFFTKVNGQIIKNVEGITLTNQNATYCSPGTIITPNNPAYPVNISGNSQVLFTAGEEIQIRPGFNTKPTGIGYTHFSINQSGYAVQINNSTIPEFEKLELTITLPHAVQAQIENFANNNGGLNPFDPDQVSIEATFTSPSGHAVVVYGFYFRDFQYTGNVTTPDIDTWWEPKPGTDENFRIRFSPDEVGLWNCTINVNYPGLAFPNYSFCDFQFNCSSSSNKGYVTTGNNGYLKFSKTNESFFPVGCYLGWANDRYDNTGYHPKTNPFYSVRPIEYEDYMEHLQVIKNSGGNYVRVMISAWSWSIEWEKSGNYYERMPLAWELDRVIKYCEDNDIYVSLSIIHALDFMDFDVTTPSTSGDLELWDENPYKQKLILAGYTTEPVDPTLFVTNSIAINQYKKYVRYVMSRWAYSDHIAKIELGNETNQIGHPFSQNDEDDSFNAYTKNIYGNFIMPNTYQYGGVGFVSSITGNTFAKDLGIWHHTIASYIKNSLNVPHILTGSYALGESMPDPTDQTYSDPLISTIGHHSYHDNYNCNLLRKYMINEYKQIYSNKPVILEEMAASSSNFHKTSDPMTHNGPNFQNDAEMHNAMWAAAFMGAAGSTPALIPGPNVLNAPGNYDQDIFDQWLAKANMKQFYADNIPALSAFMSSIDFESHTYTSRTVPQYLQLQNSGINELPIESYILESNGQAAGWVHLKRWYWGVADNYGSNCRDENGYTFCSAEGGMPADPFGGATPAPVSNEILTLNIPFSNWPNMYTIEWYDTRNPNTIIQTENSSGIMGFVHFQIPELGAPTPITDPINDPNGCPTCRPDIAFKMYETGNTFHAPIKPDVFNNVAINIGLLDNVAHETVYLSSENAIYNCSLEVYDMLGNLQQSEQLEILTKMPINISTLSAGMYIIKVSASGGICKTLKFVKE
jgi:hypothetical protein